jgi:hypothetical protein
MESGDDVENNDCGASPRIPACGLHPGYGKQGMGDQCPPEPKCPLSSSSNCPSISAATAFVARMESGEGVENIDCGASPRIPACGLHPGYGKQGMSDQCSFEPKVPFEFVIKLPIDQRRNRFCSPDGIRG